jgi:hypothetical protein
MLGCYALKWVKREPSFGYVSTLDSRRRTIWIADDIVATGSGSFVHADEKLTAFLQLESAIRFV